MQRKQNGLPRWLMLLGFVWIFGMVLALGQGCSENPNSVADGQPGLNNNIPDAGNNDMPDSGDEPDMGEDEIGPDDTRPAILSITQVQPDQVPENTLQNGALQLIGNPEMIEGTMELGEWQVCADNHPVDIQQVVVEYTFEGAFDIPMRLFFWGQDSGLERLQRTGGESVTVDTLVEPFRIDYGTCFNMDTWTNLPFEEGDAWGEAIVTRVVSVTASTAAPAGMEIQFFNLEREQVSAPLTGMRTEFDAFEEPVPSRLVVEALPVEDGPEGVIWDEEGNQIVPEPEALEGLLVLGRFRACAEGDRPIELDSVVLGFQPEGGDFEIPVFVQSPQGEHPLSGDFLEEELTERDALFNGSLVVDPGVCHFFLTYTPLPLDRELQARGRALVTTLNAVLTRDGGVEVIYIADGEQSNPPLLGSRTVFTDGDIVELPPATLEVRPLPLPDNPNVRLDDGVRIVDNLEEAEPSRLDLALYEACARGGPVPIASPLFLLEGGFNLPLTAWIGEAEVTREVFGNNEFSLLEPQTVEDGECITMGVYLDLPVQDSYAQAIWPALTVQIPEADVERVQVLYIDGRFNRAPMPHTLTVFSPEHLVEANSQGYQQEQPLLVSRNEQFVEIGNFRLRTEYNQRATIRSVLFCLEGEGAPIPARLNANFNSRFRWEPETEFEEAAIQLVPGTCYRWEPTEPEPIQWGESLRFYWSAFFVPEGAERIQMVIREIIVDEGEQVFASYPQLDWAYIPFDRDLPWNEIEFIDPEILEPFLRLDRNERWREWRARHYVWDRTFNSCYNQETEQEDGPCRLLELDGRIDSLDDRRDEFYVERVAIRFNWTRFNQPLNLRVTLHRGYDLDDPEAIVREIQVRPDDPHLEEFELGWELNFFNEHRFGVLVELIGDDLPSQVDSEILAPLLRVDIVEATAYNEFENPISTLRYGPEEPGRGQYTLHELPSIGPDLIFAGPELWLDSVRGGRPIELSVNNWNGEETRVFDAQFEAPFGEVSGCFFRFKHNSMKAEPPAEDFALRVGGSVFGLTRWDETHVTFETGEFCPTFFNGFTEVQVTMRRPTEATLLEVPMQFELVQVDSFASDDGTLFRDVPVPLILEERIEGNERVRTYLSEENTRRGPQVIIVE